MSDSKSPFDVPSRTAATCIVRTNFKPCRHCRLMISTNFEDDKRTEVRRDSSRFQSTDPWMFLMVWSSKPPNICHCNYSKSSAKAICQMRPYSIHMPNMLATKYQADNGFTTNSIHNYSHLQRNRASVFAEDLCFLRDCRTVIPQLSTCTSLRKNLPINLHLLLYSRMPARGNRFLIKSTWKRQMKMWRSFMSWLWHFCEEFLVV